MPNQQPSNADRVIGHVLVSLAAGYAGSKIAGLPGFIVGAILGPIAHYEFDEPVAQVVADLA